MVAPKPVATIGKIKKAMKASIFPPGTAVSVGRLTTHPIRKMPSATRMTNA